MSRPRQKKYATERDYQAVGKALQAARERSELTQKEVSEILDTSVQLISNYEAGMAVPPLKKLTLLVQLYKLDPNELLEIILDAERVVMRRGIANGPKLKRIR